MIKLIEIKGKRYPFLFDMEVGWDLMNSGKIEFKFDEVPDEKNPKKKIKVVSQIVGQYNDIMGIFLTANNSAIEYQGSGDRVTLLDLKNGIREKPLLWKELQTHLAELVELIASMQDDEEGKDPGKKKKSPGTNSSK